MCINNSIVSIIAGVAMDVAAKANAFPSKKFCAFIANFKKDSRRRNILVSENAKRSAPIAIWYVGPRNLDSSMKIWARTITASSKTNAAITERMAKRRR